MCASPANPKGLALVCVGFDEETPALVASAISLARRTGEALRFVHAVELMPPDVWVVGTPFYTLGPVIAEDIRATAWRDRETHMKELMESLPSDVTASSALLDGEPASAIISEAKARQATLIVTACLPDHYGTLTPKGFSTALSLMATSPVPVLVTNRHRPVDFSKGRVTLLLADDLQPSAESAAQMAFELAAKMSGARIRHTHVHGDFREVLRHAWVDLKAHQAGVLGTPEALLKSEHDARVVALAVRGGAAHAAATARGAVVEVNVRTGDVTTELGDEIQEVQPDLVVFGRHRTFKARPFLIGRVGLKAMLEAKFPVLVVPPTDMP